MCTNDLAGLGWVFLQGTSLGKGGGVLNKFYLVVSPGIMA